MATQHPEALLISAVLQTSDHKVLAKQGVSAAIFHVYKEEMEWLERKIQATGRVPSKQAIKQQYPDFSVYKVDDVDHWCDEVRKEHKRQSIIDLMSEALTLVDAGDEDNALRAIQSGTSAIQATSGGMNTDFDILENWEEVYESVSNRVDRVRANGFAGIPSGFTTMDGITGGWQPGWFGVMAARLGQGKTWTGVRMAWHAALTQHRVCYFSLEQSKFQIGMRVHAFGSQHFQKQAFNPMDLNRGKGFDLMKYKAFLQDLKDKRGEGRFYINDTSRGQVTPSTVAQVIAAKQPDIVFIDYLTLLGATSDDWRGTAKLSSEIQSAAQRFNIPIVAMSQVNRLGGGKDPSGAEHLSQADAIGQDADLVLTMAQQSKSVMKMKLAKFRHGPGGDSWYAKFSPGTGEYFEIDAQAAQDQIDKDDEVD